MPRGRPLKNDGNIGSERNDKHPLNDGYRTRLIDLLRIFCKKKWLPTKIKIIRRRIRRKTKQAKSPTGRKK